jgi:hypothetical protein
VHPETSLPNATETFFHNGFLRMANDKRDQGATTRSADRFVAVGDDRSAAWDVTPW